MTKPRTKISRSLVSNLNLNKSTIFLPTAKDTKRLESINAMIKSIPIINATGKPIMVTASKIIKIIDAIIRTNPTKGLPKNKMANYIVWSSI